MGKRLRKFLSFVESHVIKKNEKKILRKFFQKKKKNLENFQHLEKLRKKN